MKYLLNYKKKELERNNASTIFASLSVNSNIGKMPKPIFWKLFTKENEFNLFLKNFKL